MDKKKLMKKTGGVLLIGAGCVLKLAEWGLSASEVVLNGGKNMADSFAPAPEIGVGKSLLSATHKGIQVLRGYGMKLGKGLMK